ncbi:MAG: beta-phosphoglucomutase [Planctomycetota bacterium]
MNVEAVIFDLDGVLVATDREHAAAWRAMAEAEGIPLADDLTDRLRGVARAEGVDIMLAEAGLEASVEERQRLGDAKNALYLELIAGLNTSDAAAGAHGLLTALQVAGVKLAVGSSSRNARLILDRLNLTAAFDAIVDGNDVQRGKPDPEVFLLAAEAIGVEPSQCVVIEDAATGLAAAHAAGMRAVAVGRPDGWERAIARVDALTELTAERLLRTSARTAA